MHIQTANASRSRMNARCRLSIHASISMFFLEGILQRDQVVPEQVHSMYQSPTLSKIERSEKGESSARHEKRQ